MLVVVGLTLLLSTALGFAQGGATTRPPGRSVTGVAVPNFWDYRTRPERPTFGGQRVIRFLTDDDYPPLHFAGPDGVPTGFMVELARAACEVIDVVCTVQARRFDTLLDSLSAGRGDAIAAAIPINANLRARFAVTAPYHKMPARFIARTADGLAATPEGLRGKRVGVVGGTAHEAYLQAYFPDVTREPRLSFASAVAALQAGDVDAVFGDGLTLSLWLNGVAAADCCRFLDGPYLDATFFGEGVGFVLRPEDDGVRRALDYALYVLAERGTYAELYLRFFPIGFY